MKWVLLAGCLLIYASNIFAQAPQPAPAEPEPSQDTTPNSVGEQATSSPLPQKLAGIGLGALAPLSCKTGVPNKKGSHFSKIECKLATIGKKVEIIAATYSSEAIGEKTSYDDLIGLSTRKYGPAQRESTDTSECDPFNSDSQIQTLAQVMRTSGMPWSAAYRCAVWENDKVKMTLYQYTTNTYIQGVGQSTGNTLAQTLTDKPLLAKDQADIEAQEAARAARELKKSQEKEKKALDDE
jgi:hypothetical protein